MYKTIIKVVYINSIVRFWTLAFMSFESYCYKMRLVTGKITNNCWNWRLQFLLFIHFLMHWCLSSIFDDDYLVTLIHSFLTFFMKTETFIWKTIGEVVHGILREQHWEKYVNSYSKFFTECHQLGVLY